MKEEKTILHIDMDAFYASVERNRRDLEGPIVVCVYSGRTSDSGAVSTCSYEARELGIHAAMPISRAKNIAENSDEEVHFIGMDKDYYRSVSDQISKEIYGKYAEAIEQASIDEAYLQLDTDIEQAIETAKSIQEEVNTKFNLTCSIGIGPNKLISKIASDQEKPEGLTIVKEDEIQDFLEDLELQEIHGIGNRTVERLEELGITSVRELGQAETALLIDKFGQKQGLKLKEKGQGKDDSEVKPQKQKQITRITTLGENSAIKPYIQKYFPELAEELIDKAKEKGVGFRKISLIIIDDDIQMSTRSTTLKNHVQEKEKIVEAGNILLEEFLDNFSGQVRRIGLRIGDLNEIEDQSSLKEF